MQPSVAQLPQAFTGERRVSVSIHGRARSLRGSIVGAQQYMLPQQLPVLPNNPVHPEPRTHAVVTRTHPLPTSAAAARVPQQLVQSAAPALGMMAFRSAGAAVALQGVRRPTVAAPTKSYDGGTVGFSPGHARSTIMPGMAATRGVF